MLNQLNHFTIWLKVCRCTEPWLNGLKKKKNWVWKLVQGNIANVLTPFPRFPFLGLQLWSELQTTWPPAERTINCHWKGLTSPSIFMFVSSFFEESPLLLSLSWTFATAVLWNVFTKCHYIFHMFLYNIENINIPEIRLLHKWASVSCSFFHNTRQAFENCHHEIKEA